MPLGKAANRVRTPSVMGSLVQHRFQLYALPSGDAVRISLNTRAMKASRASRDENTVACPETTCSTRPDTCPSTELCVTVKLDDKGPLGRERWAPLKFWVHKHFLMVW